MRLVVQALVILLLSLTAIAQETGVLRVSVALTDAEGHPIPIPRVLLLISDNPASGEPRRVRTGTDGVAELKLRPGNYTVETDQPVSLRGQAYGWIQDIDVVAGRDAVLALTATNASIETTSAGSISLSGGSADAAAILNKWQRSIVSIWTPTAHATGFLIDSRGLIATNYRAIGDATTVTVQLSSAVKVPGRVIASDRLQGVRLIWIDPASVASLPPVPLGCRDTPAPAIEYEQKIAGIIAPLLEPKDAILGTVSRVGTQSFQVDWRLTPDAAGGPVFAGDGAAIGITVADEPQLRPEQKRADAYVIPIANACPVVAAAEKQMSGSTPPPATPLRVEGSLPRGTPRKLSDPKTPRLQIPTIAASDFDVALMTPEMGRQQSITSPRGDFANWTDYVSKAPPLLLVRVTPQFEESFWKTLARGAAQTQGMALPPMKSFNANFLRMRAFCGAAEVAPINPLIIERQVADRAAIREGLYSFALTDFGPHCGTVRFDLYSEKSGSKPDSRTMDPALFTQIANQS